MKITSREQAEAHQIQGAWDDIDCGSIVRCGVTYEFDREPLRQYTGSQVVDFLEDHKFPFSQVACEDLRDLILTRQREIDEANRPALDANYLANRLSPAPRKVPTLEEIKAKLSEFNEQAHTSFIDDSVDLVIWALKEAGIEEES